MIGKEQELHAKDPMRNILQRAMLKIHNDIKMKGVNNIPGRKFSSNKNK